MGKIMDFYCIILDFSLSGNYGGKIQYCIALHEGIKVSIDTIIPMRCLYFPDGESYTLKHPRQRSALILPLGKLFCRPCQLIETSA